MKHIISLFLLLTIWAVDSDAQTVFLESSQTWLIGPKNVSIHTPGQAEYYQYSYNNTLRQNELESSSRQDSLTQINSKKLKIKKKSKVVSRLERTIKRFEKDKKIISYYIELWEGQRQPNDPFTSFSLGYDEMNCYSFYSDEREVTFNEVEIEYIQPENNQWSWEEYSYELKCFPEKHSVKISESTTKWVKKKADRNCLSSNPEDCMVWCLVEVPATYASFFGYKKVDTCPDGFTFNIKKTNCTRRQFISHIENPDLQYVQVIHHDSELPLYFDSYKRVECQ